MSESFLHYLWQFQYFSKDNLLTTSGEPVVVFNAGILNSHAGPDFQNCRVKIGELEWIGSVEIHIYSSGWNDHGHNDDAAYDNVVLHVVWQDNKPVHRSDNSTLPTLELKNRVEDNLILRYRKLVNNPYSIPCSPAIANVPGLIRLSMLDKALAIRLENKSTEVLNLLQRNHRDWEETCYQLLARNFGFKVNGDPFMQLAQHASYKIIMKHADKEHQIEALLFGQAGFLEGEVLDGEYPQLLQREYRLLMKKFDLEKGRLNKSQWRFLRLRPANFPGLRIAQFAALLYHRKNIFSSLLLSEDYRSLNALFSVNQSAYWLRHYQFGIPSTSVLPSLGGDSINNIMINTVVPLLAAWSRYRDDPSFMDRAVSILQEIKGESNAIIRQWAAIGVACKSSADSQGLLELYNHFCSTRRCLDCNIGAYLIRPV